MKPKILHIDENHPLLVNQLHELGFENVEAYQTPKEELEQQIDQYEGIIIRSRFKLDKEFLQKAKKLKFIGRVGAGLENIDTDFAAKKNIQLFNAPEGNRNAVGEHALGMLLSLLNKLHTAHQEVCAGVWKREENRGFELDGKTIGIIGYGNMGKAFAKKLRGFDVKVLCYDTKPDVSDENAKQVSLAELQKHTDVLSLHTPITPETKNMLNAEFFEAFKKPFWFINTARGNSVVTEDLVVALKEEKILGAALDVLEYEKSSFENLFEGGNLPEAFAYLTNAKNVILSPHIAGWTQESKIKLAQTIVDKVKAFYA
ncbi:2-hydroxyacid dehydrogenase [Psychroflexus salis]|uniref:2-hydroxyacid dehydrogenase n=1 Tax=Psychroflexus salis TaxID=1526574 RepID=A0A916ZQY4_9FLAO|nr:2-hydroxyacid dehydrogenase [Psychroflexus salis]GGE08611.1 2-hydroxyacid dehydrogenase [Psychroflexus salis]